MNQIDVHASGFKINSTSEVKTSIYRRRFHQKMKTHVLSPKLFIKILCAVSEPIFESKSYREICYCGAKKDKYIKYGSCR